MADDPKHDPKQPKELNIGITELHSAITALHEKIDKIARPQCYECSCGPCIGPCIVNFCQPCHPCHPCYQCAYCVQCYRCVACQPQSATQYCSPGMQYCSPGMQYCVQCTRCVQCTDCVQCTNCTPCAGS
jgi:hypothetical protein